MPDEPTNIRIEGIDRLLKKLGRMGSAVYKPAIAEAATHIKSVLEVYPPRRYGKQPFKTARQRAYVMWALNEGLIEIPYRRGLSPGSQALGRRWTIEFRDNGKTAIVGNNVRYGPLVQGADTQSRYHQLTGWKTDRQVATEEAPAVKEILARHIREAWRKI